jgi:hypothetical protein
MKHNLLFAKQKYLTVKLTDYMYTRVIEKYLQTLLKGRKKTYLGMKGLIELSPSRETARRTFWSSSKTMRPSLSMKKSAAAKSAPSGTKPTNSEPATPTFSSSASLVT